MRAILVAFLVAGLVEVPALAAPSKALGVVMYARHARLGAAEAASGTTLFAGDQVSTYPAGIMRLRLGPTQVYLLGDSSVTLGAADAPSSALLERGTVGFASSGTEGWEILASDARILARTSQPTHGQVTFISPNELVVTSYRGTVEIIVDNETLTVPAATSYRVFLQDRPPQKPEGAGKEAAKRKRIAGTVITLVAVGALIGGLVAWRASVSEPVSPSVP